MILALVLFYLSKGYSEIFNEELIVSTIENRLFKQSGEVIMLSNKDGYIKCCDVDLNFVDRFAILNTKSCIDGIRCNDKHRYYHEFSKNDCRYGYPYGSGCAQLNNTYNNKNENCKSKKECFCIKGNFYCDSLHGETNECLNMDKYKLNDEGEIVNDYENGYEIGKIYVPICLNYVNPIMTEHYAENGYVKIKLRNKKTTTCEIGIVNQTCHDTCNDDCIIKCKIPSNASRKELVTIKCGSWYERFWLFRGSKSVISSVFQSHSKWTSLNKILAEIIIIDAILGYFIFFFMVNITIFCYRNFYVLYNFIKDMCKQLWQSNMGNKSSNCNNCGNLIDSIEDAFLHTSYCCNDLCPYCQSNVFYNYKHIPTCSSRRDCLIKTKQMLKEKYNIHKKEISNKIKAELFSNIKHLDKKVFSIWQISLIILIILIIVVPANSIKMPCTHSMGETAYCDRNDLKALRGDPFDHHNYGQNELSMNKKVNHVHGLSPFQMNTLARLKVENYLFRQSTSENTIVGKITDCNSKDNKCKHNSEIFWTESICENQIKSFKIKEEGMHESTVNIFMVGIEHVTFLQHLYDTSCWKLNIKEIFSCTGDCENVCLDNNKRKCPKRTFKKSHDTSWAHNPINCLSVNSGCTCARAEMEPDFNKGLISIYKKVENSLRAVVCVEVDNIHIDCEIVKEIGTYKIGKHLLQVNTWMSEIKIPHYILTKQELLNNNIIKTGYTANVCEKGKCNLGEFGDLQMPKGDFKCEDNYYASIDDLKAELQYHFATNPKWEISYPKCGYETANLKPLSSSYNLKSHYVNISKDASSLTVTSGCVGKMSMNIELREIDVYKLEDNSRIESFKIPFCLGEYGSELGAICTFSLALREGKIGTMKLITDDYIIIQDDNQVITEGENVFRKFMFVRGLHTHYKICAIFKEQKECIYKENNFTAPVETFQTKDINTFATEHVEVISTCNNNISFGCIWMRIKDLGNLIYRVTIYIMLSILLIFIILVLWKIFDKLYWKKRKGIVLSKNEIYDRLNFLIESGWDIKKLH